MSAIPVGGGPLDLCALRRIARQGAPIELAVQSHARIEAAAAQVAAILDSGETVYGVNTGIGKLAGTRIPRDELERLQRNIVLSHAAGTGPLLDAETVRLVLALKVASFAQGYSGVRRELVERLVDVYNAGVVPPIPAKGSVGASGDLAPLAHLACFLLEHGATLGAKEGIAFINGTQVSTALALKALFDAEDVFQAAVVAGALSVDAAAGSDTPFDKRIQAIRGHRGQIDVAARYRDLLEGSAIRESHRRGDPRVQDPYCLRCQPQVMGACLGQMRYIAGVLLAEANGVSDNPLVFTESGQILSGGNFHAAPVALAADALAVVIAQIGGMSERRIALLIDPALSGLPAFLVRESGLNSGFMLAQVSAAALAAENKLLAHPASVDSIPTSANQEDFVSMATHGARRLLEMAENCATIVGIELLCAAQGVELRAPLRTSATLGEVVQSLRETVPFYDEDRYLAADIEAAKRWVRSATATRWARGLTPSQA